MTGSCSTDSSLRGECVSVTIVRDGCPGDSYFN